MLFWYTLQSSVIVFDVLAALRCGNGIDSTSNTVSSWYAQLCLFSSGESALYLTFFISFPLPLNNHLKSLFVRNMWPQRSAPAVSRQAAPQHYQHLLWGFYDQSCLPKATGNASRRVCQHKVQCILNQFTIIELVFFYQNTGVFRQLFQEYTMSSIWLITVCSGTTLMQS